MNLLSNTYIFYADIYFIQNFLIKLAVLYLSLFCNKLHFSINTVKGIVKIMLASFLGTILEIAGLLLGNSYNLFLIVVHLLEIPLMVLIVMGKERHSYIKILVTGYFFVMIINGVLEVLWNWFGEYGNFIFLLGISCSIVYVVIRIWQNYNKMQKGIFPVEIMHKGKHISTYGFYDSGNCLQDPYTGKGVHIISRSIIAQLSTEDTKNIYIPFQSLGKEQGVINIYYLEHIRIQKEQKIIEEKAFPVGVAEEELFQNKKYQLILNEDIW